MASRSIMDTPSFPVKNTYLDTSMGQLMVQAISGKRIKVLAVAVISKLANDVYFMSGSNKIGATMPLGNNGGFVLPFQVYGWFETNEGEGLSINLSVATPTGIMVSYIED